MPDEELEGLLLQEGLIRNRSKIFSVQKNAQAMAKDMKKRRIAFVGPVITYSFLQAVGIVNDHLADCECRKRPSIRLNWRKAVQRSIQS